MQKRKTTIDELFSNNFEKKVIYAVDNELEILELISPEKKTTVNFSTSSGKFKLDIRAQGSIKVLLIALSTLGLGIWAITSSQSFQDIIVKLLAILYGYSP